MQMSFEVLFTAIGVLLKRRIGNRRMDYKIRWWISVFQTVSSTWRILTTVYKYC